MSALPLIADTIQPLCGWVCGIAALLLLLVHVVLMSAQALGILVSEKEEPLTEVRMDVVDVAWQLQFDPQLHTAGTVVPRRACAF